MTEGRVRYEKKGRIGQVLFDNPAARNALTSDMWCRLSELCGEIAGDRDVRVVTFRGVGGKAFVSGTDISRFLTFETGAEGIEYEREVGNHVAAVEELPQATVAIIEGWAVGGGLAIAFACDFRLARTGSRFGSPIGRTIGNCLASKSYARIVAHVGPTIAKRMLLLGEILDASQMQALGFLEDVVEGSELDAAADSLVERLLQNAPLTVQASKEAIRRLAYSDLPNIDDLIDKVYASDDFKSGVRNFVSKQKPAWTGT